MDFESFCNLFLILEQRLMRLIDQETDRKVKLQSTLIPKASRVLLRTCAFRDGILNRMPELENEIGRGQYGVVYSTQSDWSSSDKKMEIAIKAVVPNNDRQWSDQAQEYFYMKHWIGQHRNIVHVLGVLIDQTYGSKAIPSTQVLLVLERCNYDLHSALRARKYNYKNRIKIASEIG